MRYDVVVVGGGSAGAVLASRLSQNPATSVLLLEAGPDHTAAATPPGIAGDSMFAALDEPGRTFADLVVRHTVDGPWRPYLRGRGIGGSSAVNAMIGMWGIPDDYDHWERDLGCVGWGWSDVAPVFAQLAIPTEPTPRAAWGSVGRALVDAAESAGHPFSADTRSAQLGAGPAWLTRRDGQRVSTNDAYLEPARGRRNLKIRGGALVDRVLFDGFRAVGVQLADGDVVEAARVIMSAGAIHSPAILLRSGVQRAGIGLGLKDHPSASLTLALRAPSSGSLDAATLLRWSSPYGTADLQVLALNRGGLDDSVQSYGIFMAALMQVRSSGTIELAGADPIAQPLVTFHHLEHEHDRRRLRDAVRHAATLAATEPVGKIAEQVFIDSRGTPLEALPTDDDGLDQWLQRNIGNYVHASSSCRMGPRDDDTTVVDTRCRVHGYEGLLVCDASVFPDLPRANTHLPAVMVAERLSEMLLDVVIQ